MKITRMIKTTLRFFIWSESLVLSDQMIKNTDQRVTRKIIIFLLVCEKLNRLLNYLSKNKDVIETSGKTLSGFVFDINDVEGSSMFVTVHESSNTSQVTTSGYHTSLT